MKIKIGIVFVVVVVITIGWIAVVHKTPKTVDYYKKHEAELNAVHRQCLDNPAELSETGDCINSQEAKLQLIREQGRRNSRSISNSIKNGF